MFDIREYDDLINEIFDFNKKESTKHDIDEYMALADKMEFEQGEDMPGIHHGERGEMTAVRGYDKKGNLLFFSKYNKAGDFRLSLYSDDGKDDLYSDDLEDLGLSSDRKKKLDKAKKFVDKLKAKQPSKMQEKTPSLAEQMEKGVDVKLSKESRLSFAPDIENLRISKDKNGVLHMTGASKDGKQRIDFSIRNGNIEFELDDGNTSRSYNNKIGGKFTWRDLKSPTGTRYFDNDGEKYAKEMAAVMDKVKAQHRSRTQQNSRFSDMGLAKDGGR